MQNQMINNCKWGPAGLRDEMRAFGIDKVTSRRTIERLLEEFGGTAKRRC